MTSLKGPSQKGKLSSYEVFSQVDEQVSKPVLGSHGAESWQDFKKDVKSSNRKSVAPKAPLKKSDKLGTGFSNWEEERKHEDKVRKESGHSSTGSGYTTFKKKNTAEEAAERKRIKKIESRIRPDDTEYFIPSKGFQGWKFNYVFTSRDNSTGYYWDGMDAIKELQGELQIKKNERPTFSGKNIDVTGANREAKPKKKKRKQKEGPVMVNDPQNPLEQVAAIIQKRRRAFQENVQLSKGWEEAVDPTSGKQYYYCRATGERSWIKPEKKDSSEDFAEGWQSATDPTTGKTYYYNKTGETSWTKPTSL